MLWGDTMTKATLTWATINRDWFRLLEVQSIITMAGSMAVCKQTWCQRRQEICILIWLQLGGRSLLQSLPTQWDILSPKDHIYSKKAHLLIEHISHQPSLFKPPQDKTKKGKWGSYILIPSFLKEQIHSNFQGTFHLVMRIFRSKVYFRSQVLNYKLIKCLKVAHTMFILLEYWSGLSKLFVLV